jgi:predicted glycosyltransferase
MKSAHPRRIALYSHDGMGLGHLRRNALIACGLTGAPVRASTLLIAGARELARLTLPPSVGCLTLPAVRKVDNGHYEPRHLAGDTSRLVNLRLRVIRAALDAYRPDLLIVDKVPEGVHGELLPTLELMRKRGTRLVLGLRDILDDPEQVRQEWEGRGSEAVIEEFFDAVWVYGDPAVYDLVREYRLTPPVARRTHYTGYLDPRRHAGDPSAHHWLGDGAGGVRPDPGRGPDGVPPVRYVICQVGGGEDGGRLAEAFAESRLPQGKKGILLQGPYLPELSRHRIQKLCENRSDLRVLDFVPGATGLIRGADRVISMGGYNSVCEILATGRRGLVVPRVEPRQEQRIRAERMSEMGLLEWMHPDDLTPRALAEWMVRPPETRGPPKPQIDFEGLDRLSRLTLALQSPAESPQPFRISPEEGTP